MSVSFRCAGCGAPAGMSGGQLPFRCAAARPGDDIDHVLVREDRPEWPAESLSTGTAANPFVAYRHLLTASTLAGASGKSDEWLVDLVGRFDEAVEEVDGHGFSRTPLLSAATLAHRLGFDAAGRLWVKDETGNVSGSHKGRHLAGIMLALEVLAERRDEDTGFHARPTLAIASCGNAALAAAVITRAADWPLNVFVPRDADAKVLARLRLLGARVSLCDRQPGVVGDPCYHAFRAALDRGAIPFCCQGPDNGLTIEGGETLAWELVDQLQDTRLDAVFVQVGGGALASAVVQGMARGVVAGRLKRLPRIYAVQTKGGHPLSRAYERVLERLALRLSLDASAADTPRLAACHPDAITEEMSFARRHRSSFMWPWETEPRSLAHGILDDETYDWAAVVEGMLRSGGRPVVVTEHALREANDLARAATGIAVDHTGSSGLAGLMTALETEPTLRHEQVAVLFTGARR